MTWLILTALSVAAPALATMPARGPAPDATSPTLEAEAAWPRGATLDLGFHRGAPPATALADSTPPDSGTHVITTGARRFALVGMPLVLADASPRGVFASLGAPSDTTWRLGHWSPVDSTYRDAASGTLGVLEPGLGYWLVTQAARTVFTTGQELPRDTFEIALTPAPGGKPAWNAVANPFLESLPVSRLVVAKDARVLALTSSRNDLTERTIQVWNPATGAYSPASVVPPGGGFWIRRLDKGDIRLRVLPDTSAAAPAAATKPDGAEWAVSLTASQDGREAQPLILGAAADAGDGWNPLCASRPPSPPGRYLSLHVPRPGWGDLRGDYVRDLRPLAAAAEWHLTLSGANAPGEVRIAAKGFDLPAGARLLVSDPTAGWTRELPSGGALTVAATPDDRRLELRLVDGDPVDADGAVTARVFPSPFVRATGVALTLSRGGELGLDVYDPQGRTVRSLRRTGLEPGEHVLIWDGRDAHGASVPPGVYLGRWRAGDRRGTVRLVKIR